MDCCRFQWHALLALFAGFLGPFVSAAELPPDLNAVPRSATCFVHIRAADLWNHDSLADMRFLATRAGAQTLKTFREMFAPDPATIDRVTIVLPTPRDFNEPIPTVAEPEVRTPLVIIRTSKRFDVLQTIEKLAFRDKFYHRHHYYFNENGWRAMLIIDPQTLLIGAEESLFSYFDALDSASSVDGGPLAAALQAAAGTDHITIGVNPRPFSSEPGFQVLPPGFSALFDARCWVASVHLDKAINARVRLDFADENSAQIGEKAFRNAVDMARSGLKLPLQEIEQQLERNKDKATIAQLPEKFAIVMGIGLLRELDTILADMPIERKQNEVLASLKYERLNATNNLLLVAGGLVSALGANASHTFTAVADALADEKGDPRERQLKKIAEALAKYHKEKGSYPPAAIYDAHGRPMLSWRVALLPYFGDQEKELYAQFRLDEPWDGPNNRRLIKLMPQCYRAQAGHYYPVSGQGKTVNLVFTGKGTIFEGPKGINKKDVPPGTILLLLADGQNGTYWTRPGDLRVTAGKPLPDLFPEYIEEIHCLLADGSFRPLTRQMNDKELRAMIFRGKEPAHSEAVAKYPEAAWQEFIQIDDEGSMRALHAVRQLVATPESTLSFLQARLRAVPALDQKDVAKTIADLDDSSFQTRERATSALAKQGVLVLEPLRKTLQDANLRVEVRKRIERIVSQIQDTPVTVEELQSVRAVLVLQQIGNREARSMLAELAKGADGAMVTTHARAALRSLAHGN